MTSLVELFEPEPLIGRQLELAELTAALDDVRRGRGGLILLAGDAGIGKTRLLEAVADAAALAEMTVAWGRCWEGDGAPPFWPWTQVLRSLGHESTPLSTTDIPGARSALFDGVATALRAVSARRPLVVALEDLHDADEASLRLLQFVARSVSSTAVLILGTYRDAGARTSSPLEQHLSAVARHGRQIKLSGLGEEDVAELVRRTTGGVRLVPDARTIRQTTDGNPFFVQEVARLLLGESQLARDVAHTGRVPVPEEVHDLIRRRLHPLPAAAHDLLRQASVLGREFELGVLAVFADQAPDDLLDILNVGSQFAVVEPADLARWRFSHALLREALYDELEPAPRAALHRRAGEAIERCVGDNPASRAPQLAYHFFEASAADEGVRAVKYCSLAAEQAMAAMAFEEAARLNGRALKALALSPAADEAARYHLLMQFALAEQRGGDLLRARETYHRAVKSARVLGDPELLARAAIGYAGFIEQTNDRKIARLLEEALALLPAGDSPLRARVLVLLANASKPPRTISPEEWAEALRRRWRLASEGLHMARRVGDPETCWAALWDWHFVANFHGSLAERLGVADELVELAVAAGNRERLVLARRWRASDYFDAGDTSAFAVELERARLEADELKMPFLLWNIAMMQASLALFRGQLDRGERLAREAMSFGERSEFFEAERGYAWQRGELYFHRGQFAEFERHWRERAARLGRRRTFIDCAWILIGRAAFLTGHTEEAAAIYRDMVAGFSRRSLEGLYVCCPTQLAQLAWLVQAEDGLERVEEMLQRFAGTHATAGIGHSSVGACDRYLGQIATLRGRFDEAEAYFERAHRSHAQMGKTVWEAYTLADHAQMLLRRGRTGDGDRARRLAETAATQFAGFGMHYWEQQARLLMGTPGPTGSDVARLAREGDYWTFHYEGQVTRLRDSKGLHYLAGLLLDPGREFQAVDLAGVSDAEGARQSVSRAVKGAIERLDEANPSLGRHLRSTVRIGVVSSYVPDGRAPLTWKA